MDAKSTDNDQRFVMKKTARAPANIAFIKYWGKQDERLRLPLNPSISINLSDVHTVTTVEFSPDYPEDVVEIRMQNTTYKNSLQRNVVGEETIRKSEQERVVAHLNRIRKIARMRLSAKVVSANNFPSSSGVASSASGFAALTVAAAAAARLKLSERELTILARMGSGSACRSIPDGFVMWEAAATSEESYAYSLFPESYWDIRDIVVIVARHMKEVPSTEGMRKAGSSPLLPGRIRGVTQKIGLLKRALEKRDFPTLGRIIEEDSVSMHAVMVTQDPPVFYWNDATITVIRAVSAWRDNGLPVYATLDAGPNVHVMCEGKDEEKVTQKITDILGVQQIIINHPAKGAHFIDGHLF